MNPLRPQINLASNRLNGIDEPKDRVRVPQFKALLRLNHPSDPGKPRS